MKLEQQVCSLELAKRLKELGVKQDSEFYWYKSTNDKQEIRHRKSENSFEHCIENFLNIGIIVSAFTVAELGEMLPAWSRSYNTGEYWDCDCKPHGFHLTADTEADARAAILIYLLENKLITL